MKALAKVGLWLAENAERMANKYPELNDEIERAGAFSASEMLNLVLAYHILELEGEDDENSSD